MHRPYRDIYFETPSLLFFFEQNFVRIFHSEYSDKPFQYFVFV